MIIYSPLTSEEAVAKKTAESLNVEDNKDVIVEQGIPVETLKFDGEKDDLPDKKQTAAVASNSSTCVGQVIWFCPYLEK